MAAEGAVSSKWDPDQYHRFQAERSQPFHDLVALVERRPRMRVVDLGCCTGELTAELHRQLGAAETIGIDDSETMLARVVPHAGGGIAFRLADIAAFAADRPFDLVFSNAALQWVPDHPGLLQRLTGSLAPGGQLAVQMPANHDHPSHVVAAEIAAEAPFREALGGYSHPCHVLAPERYAALLDQLGYGRQHVRLQVYTHRLPSPGAVVEWVKGTLLTPYRERLADDAYAAYLERYRHRLLAQLAETRPYLLTFKRILLWAERPE